MSATKLMLTLVLTGETANGPGTRSSADVLSLPIDGRHGEEDYAEGD